MKVTGPGGTKGPSKSKKSGGASGSSSNFSDFMLKGTQGSSPTSAPQSIAQVDALLAVQGTDDPAERAANKRARERSDKVLGALDNVRVAMLSGNVTVGDMINVADVVASHREKISDPALTAIMDEIDLRAQVELAKMRVARDKVR